VAARASQAPQGAPAFQQLQATAVPPVRERMAVGLAPGRVAAGPMREAMAARPVREAMATRQVREAMAALRARQETALRAQAERAPMPAVVVPPAAAYL